MAMGIPMIVPEYSALGEWAKGGVHYTAISDIPWFNIHGLNTRGGIPDKASTIAALEKMYTDVDYRKSIGEAGYKLATSEKFSWRNVALQFDRIFRDEIKLYKEVQRTEDGTDE